MSSKIFPAKLTGVWHYDEQGPWIEVTAPLDLFPMLNEDLGGKQVIVDAKPLKRKRTLSQNALYWALVRQVMKYHLETQGEPIADYRVHQHNLQHILEVQPQIKEILGKPTLVYHIDLDLIQRKALELGKFEEVHEFEELSTSKLNTYTFSILIELMIRYYAENFGWELKILGQ